MKAMIREIVHLAWFSFSLVVLVLSTSARAQIPVQALDENQRLLNEVVDVSKDFRNFSNTYYLADQLAQFDPATASGKIAYQRSQYFTRQAFDNMLGVLKSVPANEFPENEYAGNPVLPFSIEFVSPRTVRLHMTSGPQFAKGESLMLAGPVPKDDSWKYSRTAGGHRYASAYGSISIVERPWRIELRDAQGKLLTRTNHNSDNSTSYTPILPFSFVRRTADYSRSLAAVFTLSPGEKIFGCGESFTEFNKRGQKVVLYADDANGIQNEGIYKPVPFFLSSRGYGMFLHTTAPITCDFGKYFSGVNSIMLGDDELDLFVFLGQPKEILDEYTAIPDESSS